MSAKMQLNVHVPSFFLLCLLFSTAASSFIRPRGDDSGGYQWLPHDQIQALPQDSDFGTAGRLERMYNPLLIVTGGCDPYPAVDGVGNLGAGLRPTGSGRGGCGNGGAAQVYVRRGSSFGHGHDAIMYSYYFPKVKGGHRHYWASVVVWLLRVGCTDEDPADYQFAGLSYTTDHAEWGTSKSAVFGTGGEPGTMGTSPIVQIHDATMNGLAGGASADASAARTILSYELMPKQARDALNSVRYEKTAVPFSEANFQGYLDRAYKESFYADMSEGQNCDAAVPDADDQDDDDLEPGEDEDTIIPLPTGDPPAPV